ncbi:MAG: carboxypeptidase regulatory-like domain-containing protein [Candidatus Desantisbacteria bacterium]
MNKRNILLILPLLLVCFNHPAQSAGISDAISYLYTQQHEDGSFGIATSFRDTCTAAETLLKLGQKDDERLKKAIGYIKTNDVKTTDYLSRKIRVLSLAGENVDSLVQRLVSCQNEYYWDGQFIEDNGFGYEPYCPSNVMDTALAALGLTLPAFKEKKDILGLVWNYLLDMQGYDGYWRHSWRGERSLSLTCLSIIALSEMIESGIPPSDVGNQIKQTLDTTALYTILQNQNEDGSFDEGTIGETANACLALLHTNYRDSERTRKAIGFIQSQQLSDGSWNNNAYETAISLQVLFETRMAKVIITPTSGTVGTVVTVNGEGFGSKEGVRVDFGTSVSTAVITTDGLGEFTTMFAVDTQSYGTHTIRAIGITSGRVADGVFRVFGNISRISPTQGTVGTLVTVNGHGFGAGETMMVDFGNTVSVTMTTTSTCGTFTTMFTVDTQAYGTHTISAIGITSGGKADGAFRVLGSISKISPTEGTVGTLVTVNGNGFGAGEAVRIDLGNTVSMAATTVSTCGTFTAMFTVDTQTYGTHTISAVGITSGGKADGAFKVLGSISGISPAQGTVGSLITVQGNGFGSSETVRVDLGNSMSVVVTTASICGTFTAIFTVSNQTVGITTIIARGSTTGQSVYAYFVVKPGSLKLTIAGKVIDTGSNKPVAGVRMELLQNGKIVMATFTTKDGRYELRNIPLGEYRVKASKQRVEEWRWGTWVWRFVWDEYLPDTKQVISPDSGYDLANLNFYIPKCNGWWLDSDYGYINEKPNKMGISLISRRGWSPYRFYLYPVKPLSQVTTYKQEPSGINGTTFWAWSWKDKKWIQYQGDWNIQRVSVDKKNNRLVIDVVLQGLWWCRTFFNRTYTLGDKAGGMSPLLIEDIQTGIDIVPITGEMLASQGDKSTSMKPMAFLTLSPSEERSSMLAPEQGNQIKTSIMIRDVKDELTTAEIKIKVNPNKIRVKGVEGAKLPDEGLEIKTENSIDEQTGEMRIKAVVVEKERIAGTESQENETTGQYAPELDEPTTIISIEDVENIAPIINLILEPVSGQMAPSLSLQEVLSGVSLMGIELMNGEGKAIEVEMVDGQVVGINPELNLEQAYCYPNPSINGQVNFERLTQVVRVRIYNLSGELVYDKTQATDGKFAWKCENNDGDKVASGVYIYLLSDPVSGGTKRGKVGVVR